MLSSNVHFSHRDAGSTGTLLPLSKFLHQKGFSSCYWKGWGKQTKCKCKPYLSGLLPMPLCFRLGFSAWMPELFMSVLYDRDSLRRKKNKSVSGCDGSKQATSLLLCLAIIFFHDWDIVWSARLEISRFFHLQNHASLVRCGLAVQSDSATSFAKEGSFSCR